MAYKYPYDDYDNPPARQYKPEPLKTNRKMWKLMLFGILTLGIYDIIFFISLSFDINKVSLRPERSKLMNYIFAHILAVITFSIVLTVWHYQLAAKVEETLKDREIDYEFGTNNFWLWYFFGSFILIGPFIYFHKLCKAVNLLCEDYNKKTVQ